ncbi:MAG: flavodoxin domain-containing protein [Candidatus Diapherotrites archaeon]|nr:flavodoxin domain-containing protein [Candidatus Diapherotrites archaeon]
MRVLVVYYSKTGNTEKVAERIKDFFAAQKTGIDLMPLKTKGKIDPKQMPKAEQIVLTNPKTNLAQYDLVFVGTPVWGMQPSPIALAYLKQLEKANGKKFVLFATCHAVSGTTLKKMSSILATKGASTIDSFNVKSLFQLNEKKLASVKLELEKIMKKF